MGSKMITDITSTQTTINDTDNFILQETAGGTTKKTVWSTIKSNLKTYLDGVYQSPVIGSTLKFELTYTAISASNPWFCLSLADQDWTTAHFSADFIAEMRTRKVIYDEMGASPVSSFGGAWAGDTFTLTDNAANVAMITALAREYAYAGSPTTNWRLLHDGTNEFNIIAIDVSARTIQVNLDSKTAAGSAIEIYKHRVYGSTTSARHFSEAGLGFYQAGGDKISGLRRLDQMQGHYHNGGYSYSANSTGGAVPGWDPTATNLKVQGPVSDGTNGDPRTGTKTEIEAGTLLAYIYVGTYTA
jgi:hypothetical protein